jgi:type IV pilus assembly protein PilE
MNTPIVYKLRTLGLVGSRGFTLIELMIVVAIVGILSSIAYSSYQSSVAKSRRQAAQGCLMELAQYMERHYTSNMSYASATLPTQQCRTDLSGYYTFTLENQSASTFTAQAAAKTAQSNADTSCSILKVTQIGARQPASGCW